MDDECDIRYVGISERLEDVKEDRLIRDRYELRCVGSDEGRPTKRRCSVRQDQSAKSIHSSLTRERRRTARELQFSVRAPGSTSQEAADLAEPRECG